MSFRHVPRLSTDPAKAARYSAVGERPQKTTFHRRAQLWIVAEGSGLLCRTTRVMVQWAPMHPEI